MNSIIIGMGEIGNALYKLLSKTHNVSRYDITGGPWMEPNKEIDVMHICIPFITNFIEEIKKYEDKYNPDMIDICTTVLPGTCEKISSRACHSTTRGLHPNLDTGLLNIKKHIAGPLSKHLANYYAQAGIECVTHKRPQTTEVAHILINTEYGINLMFADEMARICRFYGVDYIESVMKYRETYNAGFQAMDHKSKTRPILTPPCGKIGGHCITQNAEMISPVLEQAKVSAPLIKILSEFNNKNKESVIAKNYQDISVSI